MDLLFENTDQPVQALLHPTDQSEASQSAYHHALAIGIRYGAKLTLLHALGRRSTDSWPGFPSVRDTLARWRAAGQTRSLEGRIRKSEVSKVELDIRDPVQASLKYLNRHTVDMLVLATEGRSGLSRLLRASRAERLARETRLRTLFVPAGARPFVSGDTGEVTLQKILVPVGPPVDPRPAMLFAVQSAALIDDPSLEITLLNVGDEETELTELPQLPYCHWRLLRRTGDVVPEILGAADEIGADLICMSTAWRKGALGRVDGSVTERVLHAAACPVAAVHV